MSWDQKELTADLTKFVLGLRMVQEVSSCYSKISPDNIVSGALMKCFKDEMFRCINMKTNRQTDRQNLQTENFASL